MTDIPDEVLDQVEAALRRNEDTFCEGWCPLLCDSSDFTEEMEVDCSGCRSRAALAVLTALRKAREDQDR